MLCSRRAVLGGASAVGGLLMVPWLRSTAFAAERSPLVTLSAGRLAGYLDRGTEVFKGIRYGADTAQHRFMPAPPAGSWSGVRDALQFGPASLQPNAKEAGSEDCLFLNVWTPACDAGRRPVMCYIHGGAYASGSGSSPLYDGVRLCQRGDVVVVTMNHRLSAFGYLFLQRLGDVGFADSGNVGMLDLVLALRWVHDNIAAFGGDPQRVMLFGQSGGGAKIATLLAMPAARGLLHRAATMSGQQLTASGPLHATRRAETLLQALQLPPERLAEIRSIPADRLLAALSEADPFIERGSLYFGPVLDGRSLTRHPFYPDAPALSRTIPMIIGNTRDETRTLIGGAEPDSFSLTWEQLPARLARHMRVDIAPETVIREYRTWYPTYSPSEVFFAATTASRSWRAAVVEAELRALQGSPVFAYQLDWPSPLAGGKFGAPHTHDIPLVFDNIASEGSLTGTGAQAQQLADQMSDAFIAFARTGNPNHRGIPHWRPYTLPRRATLVFNSTSRLVDDPRGNERQLFEKVPFVQQGT
jgi:para-nitrobenzyl esterase